MCHIKQREEFHHELKINGEKYEVSRSTKIKHKFEAWLKVSIRYFQKFKFYICDQ